MIADVILGRTIDTPLWIKELKANLINNIIVLDYDYYGELVIVDEVLYGSRFDISNYLKKFDTVNFYKSMYVYPVREDSSF